MLGDTGDQTTISNDSGFFGGSGGSTPSSGGTQTSFWSSPAWGAVGTALSNAAGILGARYAVPQLNPGQMVQSGPYGTTLYQGGANSMYSGMLPSMGLMGGGGSLLLLGGGALLLIMIMSKKGRDN